MGSCTDLYYLQGIGNFIYVAYIFASVPLQFNHEFKIVFISNIWFIIVIGDVLYIKPPNILLDYLQVLTPKNVKNLTCKKIVF